MSNHLFGIDFKDFMKLYKDYTKEQRSFLVNDTTLSSDNSLRFRKKTYYKMNISDKIKAINNKIEQNKAQYDLDRQTSKILEVLSEKDLLEKPIEIKIF